MEIKASLKNLRMAPRKVRLVANMIKGLSVPQARAQLQFLVKKPAPFILRVLNSASANAKNNFSVKEEDLFIERILVDGGPMIKRWLPRAMGRASEIKKRTCSINIFLGTLAPSVQIKKKPISQPEVLKPAEVTPSPIEVRSAEAPEFSGQIRPKAVAPARPYGASDRAKKRHFARQPLSSLRRIFRRKSI
jgi:large subunit ribosomal protein L22